MSGVDEAVVREWRAHLNRHSTQGTVVLVCPKCNKAHREYPARINGLNRYAFKDGVCIEIDGRGCCY